MNEALDPAPPATDDTVSAEAEYQVLARSYRPQTFADVIGQEAMVRTLTNAFDSGRLAHAFILTGVRGVGKTTTARIIARALNCIGPDGSGGPTITPCGKCEFCAAIAEDRLVDVLELDAASRTGVADMRELIDGVRYRPVSARYKVYIIDEVHMLSTSAFNALLKTLEEPPERVKFIFATTEIRKVPVTILSRCQRFDLRRIEIDALTKDFARIAKLEGARISDAALMLIARAADGSHRDGLSMLDQAVAVGAGASSEIGEDDVRAMLGFADRENSFELLERLMGGDIVGALAKLKADYRDGSDPLILLQDLLEVVHWQTRIKVSPAVLEEPSASEIDKVRGERLNQKLSMATLTRAWQMLLKGVAEVQSAPMPIQAAEMLLIRLAYMADLPSPADAIMSLKEASATGAAPATPSAELVPTPPGPAVGGTGPTIAAAVAVEVQPGTDPNVSSSPTPQSFNDVIQLADIANERILKNDLESQVHLVSFQPGAIEIRLGPSADADLSNRLSKFLHEVTSERWMVTLAQEGGAETVAEQTETAIRDKHEQVERHTVVRSIMETFPGAEIEVIRTIGGPGPDDDGVDTEDEKDVEL